MKRRTFIQALAAAPLILYSSPAGEEITHNPCRDIVFSEDGRSIYSSTNLITLNTPYDLSSGTAHIIREGGWHE